MSTTLTDTETMPILVVEARGEIVKSNFDEFAIKAREWLGNIDFDLLTDDDFVRASSDAKKAKEVEELLSEVHRRTLESAVSVNAELEKLNKLSGEMRDARLKLTRQIDTAKEAVKNGIVADALAEIRCAEHLKSRYRANIETAIKGLKTLDSMKSKVRVAVGIANDQIERCKQSLDRFEAAFGRALTPDRDDLEIGDPVILDTELRRRREQFLADEREKKLREEAAAAKAELEAERKQAATNETREPKTVPTSNIIPIYSRKITDSESHPPDEVPISAEQEMAAFLETVRAAFVPVKVARTALKWPENIQAAGEFSGSLGTAWAILKGGAS